MWNILSYNISYQNLIDNIDGYKIDGFIRVCGGARYLALFGSGKDDSMYNIIKYCVIVKSGFTYVISHNYAKIKVDSCNSLPLEKTMTFRNVIILIKSVFIRDTSYYCDIFLVKASLVNYLKNRYLYEIYKCYDKCYKYCDRIDDSEGIDVKKTSESRECNICHYWYFLNKGFKF